MTDRRKALLVRAEELVRSRGYSGFSYADISEAIGIRKATIHHYFPKKEDLVATVLQIYKERYSNGLQSIEYNTPNALNRVDAYAHLYLDGIDKGLGCLCAVLSSELEILPDKLKSDTLQFFRHHITWLDKIYAIGLAKQEVSDHITSGEAARLILATLEGALMMERALDGQVGFETTLKALRKTLAP